MAHLPVSSADHSLNMCVLKLASPVFQSSPVQSSPAFIHSLVIRLWKCFVRLPKSVWVV